MSFSNHNSSDFFDNTIKNNIINDLANKNDKFKKNLDKFKNNSDKMKDSSDKVKEYLNKIKN